jgi:hypothetical protein
MQLTKFIISFFICLPLFGCNGNFSAQSDVANIKSTGTGSSEAAALNNAFSNAVRTVAGQMIISERKVINDSLMDKMISYSDGVITTYQKISTIRDNYGVYTITLNATVNKNKVTNYLQQSVTSGKVDGSGLYGYAVTARNKNLNRKEIVQENLNKYFTTGFEVKLGDITLPANGNSIIGVNFQLILRGDYLQNFKSSLEASGAVKEVANWNLVCLLGACGSGTSFYITDPELVGSFRQFEVLPDVLITFSDSQNNAISKTCVKLNGYSTDYAHVEDDWSDGAQRIPYDLRNKLLKFYPWGQNPNERSRLVNVNLDLESLRRMKNISAKAFCR